MEPGTAPVINVDGGIEITDLTDAEKLKLPNLPVLCVIRGFRDISAVMVSQDADGNRKLWDVSIADVPAKDEVEVPADFGGHPGLPEMGHVVEVWREGRIVHALVVNSNRLGAYDAMFTPILPGTWRPCEHQMEVPRVIVAEGKLEFDNEDGGAAMMAGITPTFGQDKEEPLYPYDELWFTVHSYASDSLDADDLGAANLWAHQLKGRKVRITLEILD